MTDRPIRILTVDYHPVLREGIAAIVQLQTDMEIAGEAESGKQAVERFRQLKPDVTLMDLQMPVMDGLGAIKAIREEFPAARIIVLTTYKGDVLASKALKAGAWGYLLKNAVRKELIDSIHAVYAGKRTILAEVAMELARTAGGRYRFVSDGSLRRRASMSSTWPARLTGKRSLLRAAAVSTNFTPASGNLTSPTRTTSIVPPMTLAEPGAATVVRNPASRQPRNRESSLMSPSIARRWAASASETPSTASCAPAPAPSPS